MSRTVLKVSSDAWSNIRDDLMAFGWLSKFNVLQARSSGLTIELEYYAAFESDVEMIIERHTYDEGY